MNINHDVAITAGLLGLLLLGFLSPVLVALYLSIFRGRGRPGRWLFAIAAPAFAYGLVWVAALILYFPFYMVAVFLVPGIRGAGYPSPYWVPLFDWVMKYDAYVVASLLVFISVWLVLQIWPRWPRISAAWTGHANPQVAEGSRANFSSSGRESA